MKRVALFRRRSIALALAGCFTTISAESLALPQNGTIAAGSASIATIGTAMTVTQTTNSATYNWQSFSIGQTESVHFQQPSANSLALNYVLGNTNSIIDGRLTSNGQIFLSNPNGILFGATSQVNVAGLTLEASAGQIGNSGTINVNGGSLIATGGFINNTGIIEASSATQVGGKIVLTSAGAISNTGTLRANGISGGSVLLTAGSSILQQGAVQAEGTSLAGGSINLTAINRIIQNSSALAQANGATDGGAISYRTNTATVDGGLLLSGAISASGGSGRGGSLILTGTNVELLATNLVAKGGTAGGSISVGGGFQGKDATIANAQQVDVNGATTINASGSVGDGGNVVVWSDQRTTYSGNIIATGGMLATKGGQVEVSGKINLGFNGKVNAAAANGLNGNLLLDPANIVIQAGAGTSMLSTLLFNLGKSGELTQLPNGNLIVANPLDSTIALNSGAVWMFSGANGSLISTLTGASANDAIGRHPVGGTGPVIVLPNGNYFVYSPDWNNGAVPRAGALTWGSQVTGVSGPVSAANSIVGQQMGDLYAPFGLSLADLIALPSGNYLWNNRSFSNGAAISAGAVTFIKGGSPTTGTFLANSLVGSGSWDMLGSGGIFVLPNGNYLVSSPQWGIGTPVTPVGMGAVTWGSGTTGVTGVVSAANSLIGSTVGDGVGAITILSNGNYLVSTPNWSNGAALNAGAVTWGSGGTGVSGVISAANSLVGSKAYDAIGSGWNGASGGVRVLTNGNYLVVSPTWDNGALVDAGALTWGSGTAGVKGVISAANSIVGQTAGELAGGVDFLNSSIFTSLTQAKLVELPTGNVLYVNPGWNNGAVLGAGAVTFINGNTPTVGSIAANSLIGSSANDFIGSANNMLSVTVLPNGNYLVTSSLWNNGAIVDAGAVTWGSGATGVKGAISAANSLVGNGMYDFVGSGGITKLSGGNYLVLSNRWGSGSPIGPQSKGAVTWGNGTTGVAGVVSSVNSLVGSALGDNVGQITLLPNGNYLVDSLDWGAGKGAVTWGNQATGISGVISSANSLVGSKIGVYDTLTSHFLGGDSVGLGGITVLPSGNYLVSSPVWNNGALAAAGASTWGSGATGVSGVVAATNSLVGTSAGDAVGLYPATILPNGDYLLVSPLWNNGAALLAGAVTRGSGTAGIKGAISAANSLVGTVAGDSVGLGGITLLPSGNYLVSSPLWNNGAATMAGAVSWVNGTTGLTGAISSANSLIGSKGDRVGYGSLGIDGITVLSNGNYLVSSPNWSNGLIANAGALTWGSGLTGVTGVVSVANSIVGQAAGEVTTGTIHALPTGNYLWWNPFWSNGTALNAGAVTFIKGNGPTTGTFRANSLVGGSAGDRIGSNIVGSFDMTVLSNGNYLIGSSAWSNGLVANAGAITWGSGTTGVAGVVSAANSIVGTVTGELSRGIGAVTALPSGNYLISDPGWGSGAGAVTFIKGKAPTTGTFQANSLTGSSMFDAVGGGGIIILPSGNYLVRSPMWTNGLPIQTPLGAVTWGNGATGVTGAVSAANSLVGSTGGDNVGSQAVTVLPSGNYLVSSPWWSGGAGALTWGSGTTGVVGAISATNSLVGSLAGDSIGNFTLLSNGNYVAWSSSWNNNMGAVTWGSGTAGVTGIVSAANSLVGSTGTTTALTFPILQGDQIGNGCDVFARCSGITVLPNGDYIVSSPNWNNGATNSVGAVTWVDGKKGISGVVSAGNSIVGGQSGDRLGSGFKTLSNGNIAFSGTATPWMVYASATGLPSILGYATGIGQNLILDPTAIIGITSTGTAVTLQASNDITINSSLITTPSVGVTKGGALILQAGRSLLINANITTANGALTLIANDLIANGVVAADRTAGPAVISQTAGTTLNTGSGLLTIDLRNGGVGAGVTLANVSAGSMSATSRTGTISQIAGSSLNVGGTSSLIADNGILGAGNTRYNILLANAGNNFGGSVTATGSLVSLTDINALTAILDSTGTSTLMAGGNLLVSGSAKAGLTTTTAGALSQLSFGITSVTGALNANSSYVINQNGVATNTLTVTGASTLNAANNINLSNVGNDFTGSVTATAGGLTLLTDVNALTAVLNSTGAATLKAGGNLLVSGIAKAGLSTATTGALSQLSFGKTSVTGALNATSGYVINQNGVVTNTLTVTGASTLNATSNINLSNVGNDFTGSVTATAGGLTLLTDVNALTAVLNSSGAATLKAGGNLLVSGSAKAGLTTTTTGALSQLSFGKTSVTGALNATSGYVINQNGVVTNTLTVTGASTLNATSNINLSNVGNDFTGSVTATAGGLTLLTDANALTAVLNSTGAATLKAGGNLLVSGIAKAGLSTATTGALSQLSFGKTSVTGALNATSGYVINQNGVATNTLTVTGASTLNAASNINLSNAGNDFMGVVNATSGALTLLTDVNALTAALNSTGAATVKAGGNLTVSGNLLASLATTTTGVQSLTTFGGTTVGTTLAVTSTGAVSRVTPATILTVAKAGTATPNPKVTVNGVVGALIP